MLHTGGKKEHMKDKLYQTDKFMAIQNSFTILLINLYKN